MEPTFNPIADVYDRWYDASEGRAIFAAELKCLRSVCDYVHGRWLEVGVGTGRFASMLGIGEGLDPSPRMLDMAARRGVRTYTGSAENIPFPDNAFDGVLMALTLCFIADPNQAFRECHRVLRSEGSLILGVVSADSPWGIAYQRKKQEGHPVYSNAEFIASTEIVTMAENTGFVLRRTASTLFWEPGEVPDVDARVENGVSQSAGFLGLLFMKNEHMDVVAT